MYARQRGAHVADPGLGSQNLGHEHLEDENSQAEDELKSKVSELKFLSINIGNEVREHNKLLKEVDDEFDSTFGQLQHNIQRVLKLAKSGSKYHMFYLFLFCLFVFFVIWCVI